MTPGDTPALRKARGAFFTPIPVARFIARWAVTSPFDAVLEPSCGEAVFLHEVGTAGGHLGPLVGIELHEVSAAESERSLLAEGIQATIRTGDFFAHAPDGSFDAVIGNPPYVRFHGFAGESRSQARAAALRAGVRLSGLASSWAAFTVHAALHLKPGGRLGLVLPAELMTVNYAAEVRRFLMEHFRSVGLVLFVDRVFPGVLEEVVVLLADGFDPSGSNGTDHCDLFQVQDAAALTDFAVATTWSPPHKSAKWSAGLLSPRALSAYESVTTSDAFTVLHTWGETTLGMVTGKNDFFALSPARVADLGLSPDDVVMLSPPGSRHLRQATLTEYGWRHLGESGAATWLFRPHDEPSPSARAYIASGEAAGVHQAYKCRVRRPWWRVPYLRPADLFVTYMNADTPRLCANEAWVHHLNSVHGLYLGEDVRAEGVSLLPLASLNSLTLLGAETVGRAYGGGMLKLEPGEADRLPVPSPALVRAHRDSLAALRTQVETALGEGRLLDAVGLVDDVLLVHALGMSPAGLRAVRHDHARLTARRRARGREAPRG